MLDSILRKTKNLIPKSLFSFLQPPYHYTLALLSAIIYRFPSRKIKVIGVTGTKGKSTTVEIINTLLEEAGYKTALSNTVRYKVGEESTDNLFKMSMPGRFFVQRLIRKAVNNNCDYVVLEMTSQAVIQYRHKFINLDTFVFTNLSPEHIESHGSYENYVQAKVELAKAKALVVNIDDKEAQRFLDREAERKITYSLKDAEPYEIRSEGIDFIWSGKTIHSPLSGLFNLYNLLAGISCVRSLGVSEEIIARGVEKFAGVRGRVERINAGQDFTVVVDYAHTIDSLEKLYQVFDKSKNICVLGGTGGGRDQWKRKGMGEIADKYCDEIILTNEDPYDENPEQIVKDVAEGIRGQTPKIIMDRREAIRTALQSAKTGDSVLITGKGTDPYIMGPNGSKTPWSDSAVAREELLKII